MLGNYMHFTTLLLLIATILTGCGQMGPLYLPSQKAPIHVAKSNNE